MTNLGPTTEALIAATFDGTPLISASAAAKLLGLDRATVRTEAEEGRLQACLVGKRWKYSEAALRVYLGRLQSPSTFQKGRGSTSTSSKSKASAITARPAKRQSAPPSTWSARRKTPLELVK